MYCAWVCVLFVQYVYIASMYHCHVLVLIARCCTRSLNMDHLLNFLICMLQFLSWLLGWYCSHGSSVYPFALLVGVSNFSGNSVFEFNPSCGEIPSGELVQLCHSKCARVCMYVCLYCTYCVYICVHKVHACVD